MVLAWISVTRHERQSRSRMGLNVQAQAWTIRPCAGLWVYPRFVVEVVVVWHKSSSAYHTMVEVVNTHLQLMNSLHCC
jgi:hypothetical protein